MDLMNGDLNWRQVEISKSHVQWMPGQVDATRTYAHASVAPSAPQPDALHSSGGNALIGTLGFPYQPGHLMLR
jgi:hypothetical protein